jgi:glycosyltransferase involved in cell wall biosynthesis
MWPQIRKIIPHAVLNVYCDLEHQWTNKVFPKMMKTIKETIHQENVVLHGWVCKDDLNLAWAESEYWLYPCIFEETFCLTAMEAAISKTLVITNGLAGLSETAQHGVLIPGDPTTPEWQSKCLDLLRNISDNFKESLIFKNYNWAKNLSWKSQTKKFVDQLKLSR